MIFPTFGTITAKTEDMKIRQLILAAVVGLLISTVLQAAGGGGLSKSQKPGLFKRVLGTLSWDEVAYVVESPRDICWWVRLRVRYKVDPGADQWASGREAWERGYGDCEDMAACIKDLCDRKGFDARVYVFHTLKGRDRLFGHVAVVGKWEGKIWLSNNGSWTEVDSFNEAERRIAHELNWAVGDMRVATMESLRLCGRGSGDGREIADRTHSASTSRKDKARRL